MALPIDTRDQASDKLDALASYRQQDGVFFRDGSNQESFDYNDGDEEENYLLHLIEKSTNLGLFSDQLIEGIRNWSSLYHLSPKRASLLRPFADLLQSDVLEVGAGCGALTRFLGENGGSIIAVEGSTRRAKIAQRRTADLANVRVVCDRIDRFTTQKRFNVITAIGVLEYARRYPTGAEDEQVALLSTLNSLLADGGVLILAIENKLGLKYFAGAREDHFGRPFFGINNSYGRHSAATFGKGELVSILNRAGFGNQRWYIPCPDYKLPSCVLAPEIVRGYGDLAIGLLAHSAGADPQRPTDPTFSIEQAWSVVYENGLLDQLANSFLVVAGRSEASLQAIAHKNDLAWHFALDRHRAFAKQTRFTRSGNSIRVTRDRLVNSPIPEVPLFCAIENAAYVAGQNWWMKLVSIVNRPGWTVSEVTEWARPWVAALLKECGQPDSEKAVVRTVVDGRYFDATPFNLAYDELEGMRYFDQEWKVTQPIELGYIIFRGLKDSFGRITSCDASVADVPVSINQLIIDVMAELGMPLNEAELGRYALMERQAQSWAYGRLDECRAVRTIAESWAQVVPFRRPHDRVAVDQDRIQTRSVLSARERELFELRDAMRQRAELIATRNLQLLTAREELEASRQEIESLRAERDARGSVQEGESGPARGMARARSELTALRMQAEQMRRSIEQQAFIIGKPASAASSSSTGIRAIQKKPLQSKPTNDPAARQWERQEIRKSKLFSSIWYVSHYPDVLAAGCDPFEHFLEHGASEGRDPHPLFDVRWYGARNPQVAVSNINALAHYAAIGAAEGVAPHPLFDTEFYLQNNPDLADLAVNPLHQYMTKGGFEGRDPHPLFDSSWYLRQNPDVAAAQENPLVHYNTHGWKEGRNPHPLFDTFFYLEQNPDVRESDYNPLRHFVEYGGVEGRDPHPQFASAWYREQNPDVAASEMNPLVHYLTTGWRAGKNPNPSFNAAKVLKTGYDLSRLPHSPLLTVLLEEEDKSAPSTSVVAAISIDELSAAPIAADKLHTSLESMLSMFHNGKGATILQRCYQILIRFSEVEFSAREAFATPEVAALIAAIKSLSAQIDGASRVKASVIIPAHNKLIYTLCCVYSILSFTELGDFEIIIADDASSDGTKEVCETIGSAVRVITSEMNLGFLLNCNSAASRARGEYLILLNNDTFVLPGWLDELVQTLQENPSIGLCGSKLVNADGTLQEAGGIVWKDGSAWNFGRDDDACAPQYNYLKDVDYISGAAIGLPKRVWESLGGFDEIYCPAYYEDTDLAFRVRQAGLRTVYQPYSAVIHHEGVSHGRDVTTSIKANQEKNRHIFLDRWSAVLEAEHFDNGTHVPLARDRSSKKTRIFVVDHYIPQPDRDAGSRSMIHYINLFVRSGFQVTFWPHNRHFDPPYAKALQKLGVETIYGSSDVWPEFRNWIEANGEFLDYAFLSRAQVAIDFIDQLRERTTAKILFYGHDIHFRRLQQQLEVTGDESINEQIKQWEAIERNIWTLCDTIFYPSVEEVKYLETQLPSANIRTLPLNIFDDERLVLVERRIREGTISSGNQLLFVGGFRHQPNVDGIKWFMSGAWPIIKAAVPDATLVIAGSSPTVEVRKFADHSVTVTGEVSDEELRRLYATTQVAIVPLRFGGGMKGKILEAISFGVPLVTTSVGIQGLTDSDFALVADDSETFASKVIFALLDKGGNESRDRCLRGLALLQDQFSEAAARRALGIYSSQ